MQQGNLSSNHARTVDAFNSAQTRYEWSQEHHTCRRFVPRWGQIFHADITDWT